MPGAGQKGRGLRRRAVRKRALSSPPAELLLLPQRATQLQLRKAATAVFRDLYRMLEHFEVEFLSLRGFYFTKQQYI